MFIIENKIKKIKLVNKNFSFYFVYSEKNFSNLFNKNNLYQIYFISISYFFYIRFFAERYYI
jgi:hypothetical protein